MTERGSVRRVGLVLRPQRDLAAVLEVVERWAASHDVALVGLIDDERLTDDIERAHADELADGCDLVLALGGDGTLLGALRLAAPHDVPALGVNLGHLGYLAEVDGEQLPRALASLADGAWTIEPRETIAVEPVEGLELEPQTAYNDVVLSRVPGHGQAALGLSIDGELLVRYSSDGVIAATPLGSTAYSFAAGGPIVSPRARGMVVTPDAPHGLFNRSVVLSDGERLGIEVLRRSAPLSLEVDGRLLGHLDPGAHVAIGPGGAAALVARIGGTGFADRARRKLGITDPAALADFDLAGHDR